MILFILAVWGLHCCVVFSIVAVSGAYPLVVVRAFLIAVASLLELGLQDPRASVIAAPRL